jgi:hypothetical protein
MTEADTWGNEGALGWNKGMRWATALMFIEFGAAIRESMSSVAHPFLILHDPGDEICGIEGSRMLMQQSVTPAENKELIEVCRISVLSIRAVLAYCVTACSTCMYI